MSIDLSLQTTARLFGQAHFNLIRRGADGSLVFSADRWRFASLDAGAIHFAAEAPEAPPLSLPRSDVARVTWDRLPRQRVRSQIRFHLHSGDLWTFSGQVDETALEA